MSSHLLKSRTNVRRMTSFVIASLLLLIVFLHVDLGTSSKHLEDDGETRETGKVRHLHDIGTTYPRSKLPEVPIPHDTNSGNQSPSFDSSPIDQKSDSFKDILKLIQNRKPKSTTSVRGTSIIEDDIFWSRDVENIIPAESYDDTVQEEITLMRNSVVGAMTDQTVRGKVLNSLLTMQGGGKILAKYRTKCLSIAEVSTFYLSRMLGMNNVPTTVLTKPDPSSRQWNDPNVRTQLQEKGWQPDDYITMNMWITEFTEDVSFPTCLLRNEKQLWAHNAMLQDMTLDDISDLAQWSDMVLLDYLIFHTDRVTRTLRTITSAIKEPWLLDLKIKNLGRRGRNFWLIDNEATAAFAARIKPTTVDSDYHNYLLNSTCIFRRSTVENIVWLYYQGGLDNLLERTVVENEPLVNIEDIIQCKSDSLFQKSWTILEQRLQQVYQHIITCLSQVNTSTHW
ncbi:four-jointed box protein 1-like [Glandiceps talaboti]